MNDHELKLKIDNLDLLIELEENNYKVAIKNQTEFSILQRMKENIENLRSNLQVFVDQQSVKKTGELPGDNKNMESKNGFKGAVYSIKTDHY